MARGEEKSLVEAQLAEYSIRNPNMWMLRDVVKKLKSVNCSISLDFKASAAHHDSVAIANVLWGLVHEVDCKIEELHVTDETANELGRYVALKGLGCLEKSLDRLAFDLTMASWGKDKARDSTRLMIELLRVTESLRYLWIHADPLRPQLERKPTSIQKALLLANNLQHLQTLGLSYIRLSPNVLLEVLKRCTPTLQKLDLSHIVFQEPCDFGKKVLRSIRSMPALADLKTCDWRQKSEGGEVRITWASLESPEAGSVPEWQCVGRDAICRGLYIILQKGIRYED